MSARAELETPPARLRRVLRSLARALRLVAGAPDYDRYVTHMRVHHPGAPVLSPDEFTRQRLDARYSKPGARCC